MSSTLRNKERLISQDYYITPIDSIMDFLKAFTYDVFSYNKLDNIILDACAGGDANNPMSYPTALKQYGFNNIETIDIRKDSLANIKGNYLEIDCKNKYDIIITNPPFNISLEIIKKALDDVNDDGYVIMLQRLNFLGSQKRKEFFNNNMPTHIYVHSKRMKFHNSLSTDSIEYAHYVWTKGCNCKYSELRII